MCTLETGAKTGRMAMENFIGVTETITKENGRTIADTEEECKKAKILLFVLFNTVLLQLHLAQGFKI